MVACIIGGACGGAWLVVHLWRRRREFLREMRRVQQVLSRWREAADVVREVHSHLLETAGPTWDRNVHPLPLNIALHVAARRVLDDSASRRPTQRPVFLNAMAPLRDARRPLDFAMAVYGLPLMLAFGVYKAAAVPNAVALGADETDTRAFCLHTGIERRDLVVAEMGKGTEDAPAVGAMQVDHIRLTLG